MNSLPPSVVDLRQQERATGASEGMFLDTPKISVTDLPVIRLLVQAAKKTRPSNPLLYAWIREDGFGCGIPPSHIISKGTLGDIKLPMEDGWDTLFIIRQTKGGAASKKKSERFNK